MNNSTFDYSKQLKTPFIEWFDELKQCTLVLSGDNEDECRSNHWSFSLPEESRKKYKISDIVAFINAVVSFWKLRAVEIKEGVPHIFYSWYDEMAGSLNFSLIAGTINEPLPFQCIVEMIASVEPICSSFLKGVDYISWDDLTEIESEDEVTCEDENNDFVLTVYVCQL